MVASPDLIRFSIATGAGYRATRTESELIVHEVPIFCSCERDDIEFDDDWIQTAVKEAKLSEADGYLPPMHTRHHEPGVEPRFAGVFRILGTRAISMKGKPRTAVIADLIFRDPQTIEEVLAHRFPYRSVEIFDVNKPGLNGLALLDHEAPFLELPMLMVASVQEGETTIAATFGKNWKLDATQDGSVMAHFRRGSAAHLLFREDGKMADEYEKKEPDEDSMNMEGDEGGSVIDAAMVIKAIQDGSISVADYDAIEAAMRERMEAHEAQETPEEEAAEHEGELAPQPVPGMEAMKATSKMSVQMAKLQGRIDGLEAAAKAREKRDQERTEKESAKADVAAALKRFTNRPIGDLAKKEAEWMAFRAKHGADAFAGYIESLDEAIPEWDGVVGSANPATGVRFRNEAFPDVVMKYQKDGPAAVERAMNFYRQYQELEQTGHAKRSLESYVEANMRIGASNGRSLITHV